MNSKGKDLSAQLMDAAPDCDDECVRELLKLGACNEVTPLMNDAGTGAADLIRVLVPNGADRDAVECGYRAADRSMLAAL
jgi:hypothetical protein